MMTVKDILLRKKKRLKKIVVLTAYDYPFARLVDQAGVDIVLVGDSVGMVCLGYPTTISVTMREMLHHTRAVSRAVKEALIVSDMPFGSYETEEQACRNARRLIQSGRAHAVKLEGGKRIERQVRALVRNGYPVMGHIGMTPQTAVSLGGYKVQGRTPKEASAVLKDAAALEKAGVFSIVLECVPTALAKQITRKVKVPTIGIGAGPFTDGQVLVLHDMLGFQSVVQPRFVRHYADADRMVTKAVKRFASDVQKGNFPSREESFK